MALADGIVDLKELQVLYKIGLDNYGLTPEEINEAVRDGGTSFLIPESVEDRIVILYNMAKIAWADGKIDEAERNLLSKYVVRLDFMPENADAITQFMLDCVKDGLRAEDVISKSSDGKSTVGPVRYKKE